MGNIIKPNSKIDKLRCKYCKFLAKFRKDSLDYCHTFVDENPKEVIIVASETGFKAYELYTRDYPVKENEEVYPNAKLIVSKCKYCGLKSYGWFPYYGDYNKELMDRLYPKED